MIMLNHNENSRFLIPSRHCLYSEHHRYILQKTTYWNVNKKKKDMFTSIDHMRFKFFWTIVNFFRLRKWFEKLERNLFDLKKMEVQSITSIIFSFLNDKLWSKLSSWKTRSWKSRHTALYDDSLPMRLT